ncbi:MAG: DUF504 domain-containing protein [Candidatus Micrarchaeota archaeon]|nr:DUF504 domain-containing protein [Candidatus Micrarchaeota archaeon]
MIDASKFLSRIKWDKNLNPSEFEIGIYDRVENRIIYRKFTDMGFEKGNKFSFFIIGFDGKECEIPFHRIREIVQRGRIVWKRPVK